MRLEKDIVSSSPIRGLLSLFSLIIKRMLGGNVFWGDMGKNNEIIS